ncbi:hypothetical protein BH24ACI4_BH24ACI4_28980 [soil metagenome]
MEMRAVQQGDPVPHFHVTTLEGQAVAYSTVWQHRILVLVTLPVPDPDGSFRRYASRLTARAGSLAGADAACVITQDAVPGVPCPGVVIADPWGEIIHVAGGSHAAALPLPDEVMDWIDYIQRQCPECQGEAK